MFYKFYLATVITISIPFILTAQNVGIGTPTPNTRLHVVGTDAGAAINYTNQTSGAAGSHAVKGEGAYGPIRGYLGIQGGSGFDGTIWDITGQEIGVLGISNGGSTTDNRGVLGLSNGIGVFGQSTINIGTYGQTDAATFFGIRSHNTNTTGTGMLSTGNGLTGTYLNSGSGGAFTGDRFGVFAVANATANGTGILGRSNGAPNANLTAGSGVSGSSDLFGVYGASSSTGAVTRAGGYFQTGGGQSFSYIGMRTSTGVLRKVEGNGTVNTTVEDTQGNLVVMSCPEAPENLFQDYGNGSLINGNAHISLDPIFSKNIVVNSNHPLRVFIQLEGDCNGVYVTNKTANGFDVKELAGGSSSIPFTWTVVANRADLILEDGSISPFSQERFAPAQGPLPTQTASESTAPNVKNVVLDEDK